MQVGIDLPQLLVQPLRIRQLHIQVVQGLLQLVSKDVQILLVLSRGRLTLHTGPFMVPFSLFECRLCRLTLDDSGLMCAGLGLQP